MLKFTCKFHLNVKCYPLHGKVHICHSSKCPYCPKWQNQLPLPILIFIPKGTCPVSAIKYLNNQLQSNIICFHEHPPSKVQSFGILEFIRLLDHFVAICPHAFKYIFSYISPTRLQTVLDSWFITRATWCCQKQNYYISRRCKIVVGNLFYCQNSPKLWILPWNWVVFLLPENRLWLICSANLYDFVI
jgi:hypothetical protein